jgi:hypothetical protein
MEREGRGIDFWVAFSEVRSPLVGSYEKSGVATVGESTPAQAVMGHLLAEALTCFIA